MPPEIVIHDVEQARAVLRLAERLGTSVRLRSAPGASAHAGVGYLHALGQAIGHDLVVDCHDDPGLVMAALRTGCRTIVFSGPNTTHQRLSDMAEQQGATVRLELTAPALHLALSPDDADATEARAWLQTLADIPSPPKQR